MVDIGVVVRARLSRICVSVSDGSSSSVLDTVCAGRGAVGAVVATCSVLGVVEWLMVGVLWLAAVKKVGPDGGVRGGWRCYRLRLVMRYKCVRYVL